MQICRDVSDMMTINDGPTRRERETLVHDGDVAGAVELGGALFR